MLTITKKNNKNLGGRILKKKLLILGIIMTLVFTACGKKDKVDEPKETEAPTKTTEAKEKEEVKETKASTEQTEDLALGSPINVKDSVVVLNSVRKSKDYDGKEVIVLNINWTNNSDETTSYATSISDKVFQDGQELENAFMVDGVESGNYLKEVRPGTTLENIEVSYLSISTNELEIEFDEWISFDSNPVLIKVPFPTE